MQLARRKDGYMVVLLTNVAHMSAVISQFVRCVRLHIPTRHGIVIDDREVSCLYFLQCLRSFSGIIFNFFWKRN